MEFNFDGGSTEYPCEHYGPIQYKSVPGVPFPVVDMPSYDEVCDRRNLLGEAFAADMAFAADALGETEPDVAPPIEPRVTVWVALSGAGPYKVIEKFMNPLGAEMSVLDLHGPPNHYRVVNVKDNWICEDKKGVRYLIPEGSLTTIRPKGAMSAARERVVAGASWLFGRREVMLWAAVAGMAVALLRG